MSKIPKIIHYFAVDEPIFSCNSKMGTFFRICYFSWQRFCPDYELKLWHVGLPEFQEMLASSKFLRECYKLKLWAYISDYVRCYALNKYGGIYLDTDTQLIKSLDGFLNDEFFICEYEKDFYYVAIFGGIKGHNVFKNLLDIYNDDKFFTTEYTKQNYLEFSIPPIISNVINTMLKEQEALSKVGSDQDEKTKIKIYPKEYCMTDLRTMNVKNITDNTVAIHYGDNSWNTPDALIKKKKLSIVGFPPLKRFYHRIKILRYEVLVFFKKLLKIIFS